MCARAVSAPEHKRGTRTSENPVQGKFREPSFRILLLGTSVNTLYWLSLTLCWGSTAPIFASRTAHTGLFVLVTNRPLPGSRFKTLKERHP